MNPMPIGPGIRELDLYGTTLVQRAVLYLNSPEFAGFVCNKIERRVLRKWHTNGEPLLEQINLSLQNSQITFRFRVM